MDPNLEKIRDANKKFIRKGKFVVPIIQAKSYLFNILGEGQREQIEKELKEFVEHLKQFAINNPLLSKSKPNR